MNALVEEKPRRVALSWLEARGVYILATDGTNRAFADPDEAAAATCAVVDPRLDTTPRGSC